MRNPFNQIDKDLDILGKQYDNLTQEQYDELVDILESSKLDNKPISQEEKARLKRFARKHDIAFDLVMLTLTYILGKRVITNADVFEVKTLILLDKFYTIYDNIDRRAFNSVYKLGYDNLLEDIKKKKNKAIMNELKAILNQPINRQYIFRLFKCKIDK